ncbi:head-tail joining protein [Herbaspirillum rubrisubalbicans]|uniref:Head-tail adaptor protein n=1 Tax=Herbaspirillum rubrisubalbicans TaxID=80842 RepID=A0ABX9BYW7_9BURK|nr:hypothetical protein [Herbaspirillum rubrisubalbicans]RAM63215.1 hypothetical protein RB24_18050 [Herbaspirillum rubrisubalbicans]
MFFEDLDVFFADMGKPVVWAPSGGAEQTTMGLVDAPDVFALSEHLVVANVAELTYPVGKLIGLDEDDFIQVGSVRYRVRQIPRRVDDGELMKVLISEA